MGGSATTHSDPGSPRRDDARALVAERGLASAAIELVVRQTMGRTPPSMVDRARVLLRRYFSPGPWRIDDDAALAAIVGPGTGVIRTELDADLTLVVAFRASNLRIHVEHEPATMSSATAAPAPEPFAHAPSAPAEIPRDPTPLSQIPMTPGAHLDPIAALAPAPPVAPAAADAAGDELVRSFELPIVPEATAQPRVVRFLTGPGSGGQTGWVRSADATRDDRVQRVLRTFVDVTGVLLGTGFVAIELGDEHRWDDLLVPLLELVTDTFVPPRPPAGPDRQMERARAEFAGVNPQTARGLGRVRDALTSPDPAVRQVAVTLVEHDDPFSAERAWRIALDDTNRGVRRAAIVAMARAEQEQLRGLLERGLGEADACARYHAVAGLARLGADRSHPNLERALEDNDARVRLAARLALSDRTVPLP
jgi:hypothetical protein